MFPLEVGHDGRRIERESTDAKAATLPNWQMGRRCRMMRYGRADLLALRLGMIPDEPSGSGDSDSDRPPMRRPKSSSSTPPSLLVAPPIKKAVPRIRRSRAYLKKLGIDDPNVPVAPTQKSLITIPPDPIPLHGSSS